MAWPPSSSGSEERGAAKPYPHTQNDMAFYTQMSTSKHKFRDNLGHPFRPRERRCYVILSVGGAEFYDYSLHS